jgi:hypothetical protein
MLLSPPKAGPIKHHCIFLYEPEARAHLSPFSTIPTFPPGRRPSGVKAQNFVCTKPILIRQAHHVRMFAGNDANANSERHSAAFQ